MKGMVFTEFLEMVEDVFSPDLVDVIIENSDLPSDGIYTSVGTYDYQELIQLVTNLSKETGKPSSELVQAFGQHLFPRFAKGYPAFFEGLSSPLDFLKGVENYIHVEVKKLYPEAELPTFDYETSEDGHFVMVYRSKRPFADLAHGLLVGCFKHFNEEVTILREDIQEKAGYEARFTIVKE